MNLTHLTASDFAKIAKLFKKKDTLLLRITKVDRALSAFVGGKPQRQKRAGKKRKMSAAGRRAIAAAQRKRWAKIKAGKS